MSLARTRFFGSVYYNHLRNHHNIINRQLFSFHSAKFYGMPRGVKKEHLPSKVCVVCERPFTWRKKWESVWEEVTTCSKSCNHKRRAANQKERRRNQQEQQLLQEEGVIPAIMQSKDDDDDVLSLNRISHDDGEEEGECRNSVNGVDADIGDSDDEGIVVVAAALEESNSDLEEPSTEPTSAKAARKAAKKAAKAARRAQREGQAPAHVGQKHCHRCHTSVDLLIRCTVDASQEWHMVCGSCWKHVSGGVVDGNPKTHPHYRYGGLWKNRARR